MKSLIIFTLLALLAISSAYKRRGGCGRFEMDDDMPQCGGRGDMERGRYGRRHESDAGHGYGGYGGRRGQHEEEEDEEEDEHIYRFMIGEDFGPYSYLNREGRIKGFYIDLVAAICKKAGKKCAYLRDDFRNCWRAEGQEEFPGVGLLDGYYDACVGFLPSPDRINSFNFTLPLTPNVKGALHFRKGDEGDHKNLTGLNIGFLEGWAVSSRCLKRQYKIKEDVFNSVYFETHDKMVEALLNKEVDAILSVNVFESEAVGIVADGPWFQCSTQGLSVMAHYGSDVFDWYNCAFNRMRKTGEFEDLCIAAKETHGHEGKIHCNF